MNDITTYWMSELIMGSTNSMGEWFSNVSMDIIGQVLI